MIEDQSGRSTCLGYYWIRLCAQILNLPPLPVFGFGAKYVLLFIGVRPLENVNDVCTCRDSPERVLLMRRLTWVICGYRVQFRNLLQLLVSTISNFFKC